MKKKWWQKSIVYQIYPKSFQDTNGDGIGDIQGIIRRLDYLNDLGITMIWLCPINVSPMKDNGYDIADYYKVDPSFGTNEDLEELIRCADGYGIKIIMDLVVNHCSDQHKWFQEAVEKPDSKYASYFIIEETDGSEPNNIRCYNGTSAWERIGNSNRFYFHAFSKDQPDLNWENQSLRKEIIDMMKFWQKKGIAGFRVDAIGNLKKSKKVFERKMFVPDGNDGMVSAEPFILMQDGIEEYLKELRDEVFDKYDMFTVAEVNVPENKMLEFIGENGLFSTVFDFTYTDLDVEKIGGMEWKREWTVKELKEKIFQSQNAIQKYGWGSPYLENHDQPRSVNKYISEKDLAYESKTALATLYFFLRGTPFIYQGQELGMENCPFESAEELRDPFARARYKQAEECGEDVQKVLDYLRARGRDNGRTPMQWNTDLYAGFSTVAPWINVNPNYVNINAQQLKDTKSIFNYYKEMVRLRSSSEYGKTLTYGDFQAIVTREDNLICYSRCDGQYEITIMINLGTGVVTLPDGLRDGKVILNNRVENDGDLRPYQAVVKVREV